MTTFESYKGRTVERGQRVKVYRNLHRGGYSIADAKTGLVLGYAETVTLSDAEFKVSQAGRERVLREQQKNVHAFVIGTYLGTFSQAQRHEAYYNPYKVETFVRRNESGELCGAVKGAARVTLSSRGVRYIGAY